MSSTHLSTGHIMYLRLCREKASGAPHRALPLDNIIGSTIEPSMSQVERDRRAAMKQEWQRQADKTVAHWKQMLNQPARPMHMPPPHPGYELAGKLLLQIGLALCRAPCVLCSVGHEILVAICSSSQQVASCRPEASRACAAPHDLSTCI